MANMYKLKLDMQLFYGRIGEGVYFNYTVTSTQPIEWVSTLGEVSITHDGFSDSDLRYLHSKGIDVKSWATTATEAIANMSIDELLEEII